MRLSKRELVLLLALAVLVVVSGLYYLVFRPMEQELQDLQVKLLQREQQLVELRQRYSQMAELDSEIHVLSARLNSYQRQLTAVGSRPLLLLFLQELGEQSGVSLQTVAPYEGGVSMALSGDYYAIKTFICGLEQLGSIYQLRSLNISAQTQYLLCNLSADFRQLEDSSAVADLRSEYLKDSGINYGKANPFGIR